MKRGTMEPLVTFVRYRRVRADFDWYFVPGRGYSNRYCRCDCVLQPIDLPKPVQCMAADLARIKPWSKGRKYWWDVTAAQWQAIRWFIFVVDGYQCVYCGEYADTIDHIWPVIRGGSFHPQNCVAACRSCNSRKGGKCPEEAGMEYVLGDLTDG